MHKWLWGALDFAPRNPSEVEAADPSLVMNGLAVLLPAQQTRCLSPQTGSPWHPPCLYPGGLWSEPAAPQLHHLENRLSRVPSGVNTPTIPT